MSEFPLQSSSVEKISVLIADDHSLVADALQAVLNSEPDFTSETSSNLTATLELLQSDERRFDIIMLDISMPGMDGLRSVSQVIEVAKNSAVVVFSGTSDDEFIWRAIELGAKGFISKEQPFKSFATTLRLIADGNEFVPMALSRRGAKITDTQIQIDDRERFILMAVSEGKTNKMIAAETDSTEVAIKMKMRSICTKLDAKNRTHAVVVARQKSLI
ncbi:LuxR family two component transcriptional regulator [Pacificibacter maritimus]|uniref:LuxR family two component transcriptional regulator n=1 Tax=Pacificibacter maritimus TaxID=762213 RepID=A0A3N4UL34_9RHOB|nr:response regulator transcription factor [Pacificibacter maritimus]RPE71153.1 LuxR family two component transcriptional regulator [Pacificibacter maritimus]